MLQSPANNVPCSPSAAHGNKSVVNGKKDKATTASHTLDVKIGEIESAISAHSTALLRAVRMQAAVHRVDGLIIGTGEADFTKDNVFYSLTYKDKPFSLVDVPGIEGDEKKYQPMVERAIAKAHLVFYVNGTNKKPEKTTAEKIKRYLRRGAKVCPIVNVRGSADAYEFEEDRETLLTAHNQSALSQTVDVLSETLGENSLLEGFCVQGLLGFSGLAYMADAQETTIHPSRLHDLCVQQRNYLKFFGSPNEMYLFSNLEATKELVNKKQLTFREDIVESNKSKVTDLLGENIEVIELALNEYHAFLEKLQPEVEKCKALIEGALASSTRLYSAAKKNYINKVFDAMVDHVDRVVSGNFGNNEIIKQEIEEAFSAEQTKAGLENKAKCDQLIADLHEKIKDALGRLQQDISLVYLESRVDFEGKMNVAIGGAKELGGDLGLGGVGGVLFTIGSMAYTGFLAGLPATPLTAGIPISAIIGGVIGALIGAITSFLTVFMSKDSRVRKVKGKIYEKLDEARAQHIKSIDDDVASFSGYIKENLSTPVFQKISEMEEQLAVPADTLQQELERLKAMKNKIEMMPYGTI